MISLGFGAKLPPYHNIISHCFSLNQNFFMPTIDGYTNLKKEVKRLEPKLIRSGPVIFSEILEYSIELAKYFKVVDKKQYIVLLVATDGDIFDITPIHKLLKQAHDLPLSILVAGIGEVAEQVLYKIKFEGRSKRKKAMVDGVVGDTEESTREIFHYFNYDAVRGD